MVKRFLLLLLSCWYLSAQHVVAQSQDACLAQKLTTATFPCSHDSQCNEQTGMCECSEGFASRQCGFEVDNCICYQCVNGNMTNKYLPEYEYEHHCECFDGWQGQNCDQCVDDNFCKSLYPDSLTATCDKSAITINKKTIDCQITDRTFTIWFPGCVLSLQVNAAGMNESTGKSSFQVHVEAGTPSYLKESFYCSLEECSLVGSESEVKYQCEKSKCGIAGWAYVNPTIARFIESSTGLAYLRCKAPVNGEMNCWFYQEALKAYFGEVSATCTTGECLTTPRPPIEGHTNPITIAVASALSVFLIVLVLSSMYLYRKRQQRYFAFSKKGALVPFSDLNDQIHFGNDFLHFSDIVYTLDGKVLVDQVSGYARPGEVLAIIGGSGAGKTTLLDILAQRQKRGQVSGSVYINGKSIGKTFNRMTSYVDQEPAAIGTQTVREILLTTARLRLPEVVTIEQKKERILTLACELGIEHILDRKYGEIGNRGISGGEKRRVQIACQLVTGPSIVFLDEPTSGLDSFNALSVCKFLKSYASKKNRTVIMAIHQPRSDILNTFDKLMVLGGGRLLYFGETSRAKDYFSGIGYPCPVDLNPADHILDISMQFENLVQLEYKFKQTDQFKELASLSKVNDVGVIQAERVRYGSISSAGYAPLKDNDEKLPDGYSDKYATSFWTQVAVLSSRSFSDMYRYPLLLRLHLGFSILCGLLIGAFFFSLQLDFAGTQNRIGMLLFLLIVFAFASMSSIGFMARERDVFLQERASGYYLPAAYYFVKIMFDLIPLRIIPTLIIGVLVYVMAGLQADYAIFGYYILVLVMFHLVTALICITIASSVRNISLANLVAIITLMFSMLFQGAMLNLDSLPKSVGWITYLSPFRYALNSLLVNELDGLEILFDPFDEQEPELITGRLVLSMFGFKPEWAYSIDLYSLGIMVFGWITLGLLSITFFVKEKR